MLLFYVESNQLPIVFVIVQPTFIELEEVSPSVRQTRQDRTVRDASYSLYRRLKLDWPTENNAPLAHHFQRFSRARTAQKCSSIRVI